MGSSWDNNRNLGREEKGETIMKAYWYLRSEGGDEVSGNVSGCEVVRGECNHCHMQRIQRTAKRAGLVVTTESQDGGVRVLVDGSFVAWFMKIPERCVC